jgi:NitT/TauT family transport system substrate-binding protein
MVAQRHVFTSPSLRITAGAARPSRTDHPGARKGLMSRFHLDLRPGFLACLMLAVTGCASSPAGSETVVHVGYFPNLTHSQALIGLARGDFAEALGAQARIEPKAFNAGPSVIEALFAGEIDLAYIGPNPAINGFVRSQGEALRVIAGATSGGAAFVVRPETGIRSPEDLNGKRLATPQLGNTQDVALRSYLAQHQLQPTERGGTVQIIPTANPEILDLFRRGEIDGAWVPEPWATRLLLEGGGELFIDERTLWPEGDFTTALLIVRTAFLEAHPDLVRAWLQAHVSLTVWEQSNPDEAKLLANAEIGRITSQALPQAVLDGAWSRQRVTYDPLTETIVASAQAAYAAGYLDEAPDLSAMVELGPLRAVLADLGLPALP